MITGAWIRAKRTERGWTQAELADRAQVSQATISALERGRTASKHVLERVLTALGADLPGSEAMRNARWLQSGSVYTPARVALGWMPPADNTGLPIRLDAWQRPSPSGDFVVLAKLPDRNVLIAAVDVAGHGEASVAAALYLQGWLRGWAGSLSVAPRVDSVAQHFANELAHARIEAAWLFVLLGASQQQEGRVSYQALSQSYPAPLLLVGHPVRAVRSTVDVGVHPHAHAEPAYQSLDPPWSLVVASDGLLRRLGAGAEKGGKNTLLRWQSGPNRDEPAGDFLRTNSPYSDDESISVLKWDAWDLEYRFDVRDRHARHRAKRRLREHVLATMDETAVDPIGSAVSEAVSNVSRHAYKGESGPVILRARYSDAGYQVEVEDHGHGMSAEPADGFKVMQHWVDELDIRKCFPRGTIVSLILRGKDEAKESASG